MKAGAISLSVAILLSIGLSVYLELSAKGIAAITTICIVLCFGASQLIRGSR